MIFQTLYGEYLCTGACTVSSLLQSAMAGLDGVSFKAMTKMFYTCWIHLGNIYLEKTCTCTSDKFDWYNNIYSS